jgi:hypothetical protein
VDTAKELEPVNENTRVMKDVNTLVRPAVKSIIKKREFTLVIMGKSFVLYVRALGK